MRKSGNICTRVAVCFDSRMKRERCLRWHEKPLSPLPKNSKESPSVFQYTVGSKNNIPPDFQGMEEHYDLSKMSEPEYRTHPELDALWAQNDSPANTSMGLFKSEMSPRVAARTRLSRDGFHFRHTICYPGLSPVLRLTSGIAECRIGLILSSQQSPGPPTYSSRRSPRPFPPEKR